ncbi:hypothetical protein D3C87_82850 [compost metagenome]
MEVFPLDLKTGVVNLPFPNPFTNEILLLKLLVALVVMTSKLPSLSKSPFVIPQELLCPLSNETSFPELKQPLGACDQEEVEAIMESDSR